VFLYYFPGQSQSVPADQLIQRYDLDDRIRKADVGYVMQNGPDGGHGLVLTDSANEISPRVDLPMQTWRPSPKMGADVAPYWCGYWNERKPTEGTLRRVKTLPGESIELRDGDRWQVPKLIDFLPPEDVTQPIRFEVALPKVLDINDDGDLVSGRIEPKYESLWETGWNFHYSLANQAKETGRAVMTELDARRFAVNLLNVNYRVTSLEIAMLGLFGDGSPVQIVLSAIDNATFWEAVKNRAGRSVSATTDLPSGAERPETESITSTRTDRQSVN
jgi:hypothetical protein